ncbi:hypothetical protein CDAR_558481 [Caerostris darwini]|uniref:Ribosomal protein L32 n=1 Tax=Caerostris darwini TaxID=1538125 RepID=A0AAV4S5I6_9ARAC|nr:hypothetical protein CDAR_558481 [Caerostris darwini]
MLIALAKCRAPSQKRITTPPPPSRKKKFSEEPSFFIFLKKENLSSKFCAAENVWGRRKRQENRSRAFEWRGKVKLTFHLLHFHGRKRAFPTARSID